MFKKLFNSFKKITQAENIVVPQKIEKSEEVQKKEDKIEEDKEVKIEIREDIEVVEENIELAYTVVESISEEIDEEIINEINKEVVEDIVQENELIIKNEISEKEQEYIKDIKIKRQKGLRAINLYTEEVYTFESYKECSKKLNIPLKYIAENLRYGYTDYFGEAIIYLSKKLNTKEYEKEYLGNKKPALEIFNGLHNKIFDEKTPDQKRDEILSSEKIDPIKMHYKFECVDDEYDEYFIKYKNIIQRGGKKKVELINTKGEVIEVFKSLDDCAKHINKNKSEVTEMLKLYNTKVGRYEIRYSLRNI